MVQIQKLIFYQHQYELQVSTDGTNWLDAGSGEFTREDYNLHVVNGVYNVADLVYANFDQEYTAQYVRLITKSCSLSSLATFCGAEFRLYEDAYVKAPEQQTEIKTSDLVPFIPQAGLLFPTLF